MPTEENICVSSLLVILPVDAFTGKAILQQDFSVFIEGAGKPVRKEDGFWVFTKLPEGRMRIILRGKHYQNREAWYEGNRGMGSGYMKIRLSPDRTYSFPQGTIYMEGMLSAETRVFAAAKSRMRFERLAADCGRGDGTLTVYQGGRMDLTGGLYYISEGESARGEWIRLAELCDPQQGIYSLAAPAGMDWKRRRTYMYPAAELEPEGQGRPYFLGLWVDAAEESKTVVCLVDRAGKGAEEMVFTVETGKTLHQDF